MPLQNRVTPSGEIVAHPARGLMMGNRGCLHRRDRTLGTARWRSKLWICCVLDWKGVRRDPMPPGRWTALFFLDEATALAAGHRPCAYCRRAAYRAFVAAWPFVRAGDVPPKAYEIDARLHAERVDPVTRRQHIHRARIDDLPDASVVRIGSEPALVSRTGARPWSFTGWGPPIRAAGTVEVLTPPSTVATLRAGYRPLLHPSAG